MGDAEKNVLGVKRLSEKDFTRLSEFIQSEYGIKMPTTKKLMLEARLQKRLRKLGIKEFDEYIDYIFTPEGRADEMVHMMDVVTTNKTDFFREPAHFDYLAETALPELIRLYEAGVRKSLKLWSAGCSSGEEPYTLAMVLSEFAEKQPHFRFSILATDLSSEALEKGRSGIYEESKVEPIPLSLRKKYLLRSRDRGKSLLRIKPALRGLIRFVRLNLMDEHYPLNEQMDIVFFRNVIIYFSRATQEKMIGRVCRHLRPGGYLFTGHSETLFSMQAPLKQEAPTIYRRL